MKITSSQEVELEKHATIVENNRLWPWEKNAHAVIVRMF